jgi:cell filamentation protein
VSDDPYLYPGTSVLRNRLGTTDPDYLDKQERALVALRMRRDVPRGTFDLKHLRAIHRHLFQDVYDWAGELRTVEISKGRQQFQFRKFIETGMADVHGRLERSRFLKGRTAAAFAAQAAVILGDINYIHPFREGNGRTQLQYLKQLARRPDTPSISRGSGGRTGSRHRSRATPPTTSPWRQSSQGP